MSGELWHEKAKNFLSFEFDVKFDLEGQGQSTPQKNPMRNQGVLHFWSKFGDSSLKE